MLRPDCIGLLQGSVQHKHAPDYIHTHWLLSGPEKNVAIVVYKVTIIVNWSVSCEPFSGVSKSGGSFQLGRRPRENEIMCSFVTHLQPSPPYSFCNIFL